MGSASSALSPRAAADAAPPQYNFVDRNEQAKPGGFACGEGQCSGHVLLHIYDLSFQIFGRPGSLAGAFHTGIEVHGKEYSFGSDIGVYCAKPLSHTKNVYRSSIVMGFIDLSDSEVLLRVQALVPAWPGTSYNIFGKNCNGFCAALAETLGVGTLPPWVDRLSRMANEVTAWGDALQAAAVPQADPMRVPLAAFTDEQALPLHMEQLMGDMDELLKSLETATYADEFPVPPARGDQSQSPPTPGVTGHMLPTGPAAKPSMLDTTPDEQIESGVTRNSAAFSPQMTHAGLRLPGPGAPVAVWSDSNRVWENDGEVVAVHETHVTVRYNKGASAKDIPLHLVSSYLSWKEPDSALPDSVNIERQLAEIVQAVASIKSVPSVRLRDLPMISSHDHDQLIRAVDSLRSVKYEHPESLKALTQTGLGPDLQPGNAVAVWSSSSQKWFQDGIIESVDVDGNMRVAFNGNSNCKLIPARYSSALLSRRVAGTAHGRAPASLQRCAHRMPCNIPCDAVPIGEL